MRFAGEDVKTWHLPEPRGPKRPMADTRTAAEQAAEQAVESGPRRANWLVLRLAMVPCPHCGAAVDTIKHTIAAGVPPDFWRPSMRKIPVSCPQCEQFFWAFAHPLFNWVPSSRVLIGVALLNVLVAVLILTVSLR